MRFHHARRAIPGLRVPLALGLLILPALLGLVGPFGPSGHAGLRTSPGSGAVAPSTHRLLSLRAPGPPITSVGAGVNPYAHYASEPAPMGITDFGVWPNGSGYAYTTSTFLGIARFHNFSTYTAAFGTSQSGLQLNVVLYFSDGGATYAYWIQDVVFLDTSNDNVQFLDNIWNFSAGSGGGLYSTTVTGNGSCGCSSTNPGIYIAVAGSQPGNNVNLTNPFTVELRAVAEVVGGVPRVYFDYLDGHGWQTFDTATFGFASGVSAAAFRVDGTQYVLGSLYDDAELVLGGPGGGSSSAVRAGGVDLTLEYDNGHNLEAVPNTYNFGSDTAETVSHVAWSYGNAINGTTPSDLVLSGSGTLAGLYNDTSYGVLHVAAESAPDATLLVNGTAVPYRNGAAFLSLAPGLYGLTTVENGTAIASANVTVIAGSVVDVELPPARFTVTFEETGLTPGTTWGVRVAGATTTTAGNVLSIAETNGSYPVQFVAVPGYATPHLSAPLGIAGAGFVVPVRFWPFNSTVRFDALNLPAGTPWSVTFGGTRSSGTGTELQFSEPNGTYAYAVSSTTAFEPLPASGNLTVQAGSAEVSVDFSLRPGYLVGVVRPANATVLLDGSPVAVTDGAFNLSEVPGRFALEASAPGFVTQFDNVTLTPGNATTVEFVLQARSGGGSPTSPPSGGTAAAGFPVALVVGVAVGIGLVAVGGAVLLARRRPPRP